MTVGWECRYRLLRAQLALESASGSLCEAEELLEAEGSLDILLRLRFTETWLAIEGALDSADGLLGLIEGETA